MRGVHTDGGEGNDSLIRVCLSHPCAKRFKFDSAIQWTDYFEPAEIASIAFVAASRTIAYLSFSARALMAVIAS